VRLRERRSGKASGVASEKASGMAIEAKARGGAMRARTTAWEPIKAIADDTKTG